MRYTVWGPLGGLTIGAVLFTANAFGTNAGLAGIVTLVLIIAGVVVGVSMDKKNPG